MFKMTPEKAVIRLNALLDANRFDDAMAFISSLECVADRGSIHCMRGSVYAHQSEWRLAEREYREATSDLDSLLHREALLRHASMLNYLNESQEALQQAQCLMRLYPGFAPGEHLFGQLLEENDRHEEALPYLKSAHEADPANRRVCWALIKSYYFTGSLNDGRSKLQQTLGLHEDDWDYLCVLSENLIDADRHEAAIDALLCHLKGRPWDTDIVHSLSYAAHQLNALDRVEAVAKELTNQGERPAAAILLLAEVAFLSERYDDTHELLRELLAQTGSDNWAVQSLVARVALQEQRFIDAYRIATEALQVKEDFDEMRHVAGVAASQLEMDSEAVALLRSYLERNEPDAALMLALAASEYNLENHAEACTAFEYYLKESPDDFESRRAYAFSLYESHRLQEAKHEYERCTRHDPEDLESWNNLMFLLAEMGDKDGSKEIAVRLLSAEFQTDTQEFKDLVQEMQWEF